MLIPYLGTVSITDLETVSIADLETVSIADLETVSSYRSWNFLDPRRRNWHDLAPCNYH
jgi:hypothetical protein